MCQHRSYIVTENYKVLSTNLDDHHTTIRKEHGIREEGLHHTIPHVAIEYYPTTDLFDLSSWRFIFDSPLTSIISNFLPPTSKPSWWTTEHMSKVQSRLEQDHMRYAALDSTYIFPGDLDLSSLQTIRPNTTIVAGGHIIMGASELPDNVTLIAKGRGTGIKLLNCRDAHSTATLIGDNVVGHPEIHRMCRVIDGRSQRMPRNKYDGYYDYSNANMYDPNVLLSNASKTYIKGMV